MRSLRKKSEVVVLFVWRNNGSCGLVACKNELIVPTTEFDNMPADKRKRSKSSAPLVGFEVASGRKGKAGRLSKVTTKVRAPLLGALAYLWINRLLEQTAHQFSQRRRTLDFCDAKDWKNLRSPRY